VQSYPVCFLLVSLTEHYACPSKGAVLLYPLPSELVMEHSNEPKSGTPLILHCDNDAAVVIPPALTVIFLAEAKDPHYYFHLHQ